MIEVEVQFATSANDIPSEDTFQSWVSQIEVSTAQEVALRIVDEAEIVQLNEQYRKKTGPTNVLSFPAQLPDGVDVPFLGDIVICAPVVTKEALDQGKSHYSHWAHMTVHGILHLQGYDHINEADADKMESLEIKIMHQLGFANPYI
jgi:probable rRNA maturation factor